MIRSELLSSSTARKIQTLWDELSLIPASTPGPGLDLLLERVGEVIDSPHSLWLSTCRIENRSPDDVLNGWRVRSIHFHGELPPDADAYQRAVKNLDRIESERSPVDESTYRHARETGHFRAKRLVDHVSPDYYQTEFFATHYLGRGIRDRLFVVMPVSDDVESYFMFDRMRGQADFSETDREIAAYALRGLTWFARQVHLSHGELAAEKPLTPRERDVLSYLLKGLADKAIAGHTDQTPNTTRQHVKNILRKFNVRTRNELMALWLRG